MEGIFSTLIIGLVVGALARLFLPGRQPMGILWTILIGIAGAFIGNWVGNAINPGSDPMHWILSILSAVVLLVIWGSFKRRRVT